ISSEKTGASLRTRGGFDLFLGRVLRSPRVHHPLALIFLLGAVVILPGCLATRGSVRDVSARVDQVSKEVAELRRAQEASTRETAAAVIELRTLSARF